MTKLNLTIDDKKKVFNIPTSWDEVTVKQYSEIIKIDQELPSLTQRIKIVSSLLKIEEDIIEMMDQDDFAKIEEQLTFLSEDMQSTKVEFIELDGEKYYLYTDFEKLTLGEQISIDLITKEANGNMLNVYPKLLCLFLRKKKDNGKFETFKTDHMDRVKMFEGVQITKVNQLLLFFSSGARG